MRTGNEGAYSGTTQGRSLQRGASVATEFVRSKQLDKSEFALVIFVAVVYNTI